MILAAYLVGAALFFFFGAFAQMADMEMKNWQFILMVVLWPLCVLAIIPFLLWHLLLAILGAICVAMVSIVIIVMGIIKSIFGAK